MTKFAKKIHENDNVITVVSDCKAGEAITVRFEGKDAVYSSNEDVDFGHKVAISDIMEGNPIVKYGETIGIASRPIKKGDWVHTHNTEDTYLCLDKDGKPLPGQDGENSSCATA